MRRFIVFKTEDYGSNNDPQTLKMYDKENLLVLFDELGILYNKPQDGKIIESSDEDYALMGVNDCNGDGDDYYIIGEIIGNELKVLVS